MRSRSEAIKVAKGWRTRPPFAMAGMCQKIVRSAFGIGGGFGSAEAQWYGAKHRHEFDGRYNAVPRGVAFFWTNGRYGHVVLTLGDGRCLTNDFHGRGRYTVARLEDITRGWGQRPRGWTEDLNGVRYYTPPKVERSKPKKRRPKVVREALQAARQARADAKGHPTRRKRIQATIRSLAKIRKR